MTFLAVACVERIRISTLIHGLLNILREAVGLHAFSIWLSFSLIDTLDGSALLCSLGARVISFRLVSNMSLLSHMHQINNAS